MVDLWGWAVSKPCTCGDRKTCTSTYKVRFDGAISVDVHGLYSCGKVKRDMKKTHEFYLAQKRQSGGGL